MCPTDADGRRRQRRILLTEQHQRRIERDRPAEQIRSPQREQRQRGERVPGHDPRARDEERGETRRRSRARACRATCAAPRPRGATRPRGSSRRSTRACAGRSAFGHEAADRVPTDCRLMSPECSCAFCSQPDMNRYGSAPKTPTIAANFTTSGRLQRRNAQTHSTAAATSAVKLTDAANANATPAETGRCSTASITPASTPSATNASGWPPFTTLTASSGCSPTNASTAGLRVRFHKQPEHARRRPRPRRAGT